MSNCNLFCAWWEGLKYGIQNDQTPDWMNWVGFGIPVLIVISFFAYGYISDRRKGIRWF
jgi:hypothetical protein